MHLFSSALSVALISASLTAVEAQSVSTPESTASATLSIVLTTARAGGVAVVRAADGSFSMRGERIEIVSAAPAPSEVTTLILEAATAEDDVVLRLTRAHPMQSTTFSAQRFILDREANSAQLQIRGENRRTP